MEKIRSATIWGLSPPQIRLTGNDFPGISRRRQKAVLGNAAGHSGKEWPKEEPRKDIGDNRHGTASGSGYDRENQREKMMIEYVVVEDSDLERFVMKVNALIKKGWFPQGGIASTYKGPSERGYFFQAMTRS